MQTKKELLNGNPWTWADQISTYRFWGILLFLIFLLIPNTVINYYLPRLIENYGMSSNVISIAIAFKTFAIIGGIWLAWFMVRMKNHYLLFLFALLTIIGLLVLLLIPFTVSLFICFFLIGLSFGAVTLSIPSIIAGGRGGSGMFVVSFGLILFFETTSQLSFSGFFPVLLQISNFENGYLLIGIIASIIGVLLLLPVKAELFNIPPPERNKNLIPTHREPVIVALLCLVPLYNIYYILHLSYRFHGEVNQINPTQNILSPRAAVWSTLFLSILSPIIVSSLNTNLIIKLKENNMPRFYKTWAIIIWAFIFIPISYALIQSNLNQLIQIHSNEITE